eukprot:scaffold31339_cov77-Phaeocystis_antarctica.AAC.1
MRRPAVKNAFTWPTTKRYSTGSVGQSLVKALRGAVSRGGKACSEPGQLRHRRGGGAVRRAVTGGAGGGEGCSGGTAAHERSGGQR